jgi:hypothetical protein
MSDLELLTVPEVAALLRTSPGAVRVMICRGTPPAGLVRIGRRVLFRSAELRRSLGLLSSEEPSVSRPRKAA